MKPHFEVLQLSSQSVLVATPLTFTFNCWSHYFQISNL